MSPAEGSGLVGPLAETGYNLRLFADIAPQSIRPTDPAQSVDLRILIPFFMISELRHAYRG
ncbi:hypothetical protein [Bosea psychrotolerans]|uniref:hypothetical protein n=1 Tax=Bosea psychrotolerans TaxID=1871628 RepID=UPI0011AFFA7E|nr:hypothetical protein [Bosea psychrotolerans]